MYKKLPSEKFDDALNKIEEKKETEKQYKSLYNAMNECFASEAGKTVLKYLMNTCSFLESNVCLSSQTGEVNIQATLYNEYRRSIYLELRKYIKPHILQDIEYEKET